ncbi:MAG: hypothetical protein KAG61_10985 [Bacteriovoracaceae bacterium]|nr:hypothetical protein [Bacteriovoracaceae bacterium]
MNKKKSKEQPVKKSIRPTNIFVFGSSAQTVEFDLMLSPRFNFDESRFVREVESPRDADVLMVFGSVNHKCAPILKRIYCQMNDPKWVIEIAGNLVVDSYSVLSSIDEVIPVDLYLNKISPSPLDLWNAIGELK